VRAKHLYEGRAHRFRLSAEQLTRQLVTRHAIHQTHQNATVTASFDGIFARVMQTRLGLNKDRALVDSYAVSKRETALPATAIALAPCLLAAQMAGQVAALRFVAHEVLVCSFRTRVVHVFERQAPISQLWRGAQARVGHQAQPSAIEMVRASRHRLHPMRRNAWIWDHSCWVWRV
jgi:hypothetical protein